jgi:oxygen-independent coproporphyrinogen-3 oxidase
MLGLGYAAISFANGYPEQGKSWTTMNSKSLGDYYDRIDRGQIPVSAHYFRTDADVKLSFLFQSLLEMSVDRKSYRDLFDVDVVSELSEPLAVFEAKQWIEITEDVIKVNEQAHLNVPIIQTVLASERTKGITGEYKQADKEKILSPA